MSIRKKIFLGCAVVAFIMFLAGITISFEMQRIRSSVSTVVAENVKSMNEAHNMQRFLYNQTMVVFKYMYAKNDSLLENIDVDLLNYETAYCNAQQRVSIIGEQQILDSVNIFYSDYKQMMDSLIQFAKTDKNNLFAQHYKDLYAIYEKLSKLTDELFFINKEAVENNSLLMTDNYYRMIMPAIIAILTCIILIFMLNYFIYIYFISPMVKIVKGLNAFTETRVPYNIEIDNNDETAALNNAVKKLTDLTKKHEKEN